MELVKRQDRYDLYGNDGSKIASSSPNPFGKLSKENCDEIFGVVDIRKLAYTDFTSEIGEGPTANTDINSMIRKGYLNGAEFGFNKAMELNKDKLFTVEDVAKAYDKGQILNIKGGQQSGKKYVQSLQQPTEIEVEIEMGGYKFNCDGEKIGFPDFTLPKTDDNNCLILKKIK